MAKKIPKFSYTGAYETSSDNTYWYIKLKSSGQMTFTYRKSFDVGCVGGGGGTISNRNYAHVGGFAGGGGGDIQTGTATANAGTAYTITIGAGGAGKNDWRDDICAGSGGTTSAFNTSAGGGAGGGGCDYPGAGTGKGGKGGYYINIQGSAGKAGENCLGFGPFGGGGGGGSGAGVTLTPLAFLIVSPDGKIDLKLLAPDSKNMLDKAIDMAPGIIDKIKGFSSKKDKEEVTEE